MNLIPHIKGVFFALALLLFFGQCTPGSVEKRLFDRREIRAAQQLIGLSFSEAEIDTMLDYLHRNRNGFDTLRQFKLDYKTVPALYFDPRPVDFRLSAPQVPINWPANDAIQIPANREELAFLPVHELADLIRTKQISSYKLTQFFINRLKKYDPTLKAVITITEDLALEQALKADQELEKGIYRGPLHGIPYGIKDLAAVPGYRTTWGAAPYQNQILRDTATIYEKLSEKGAVLIAKLTSGALARGDVWFGGKTLNPWDLTQGASGSSAGSASATAAGLVPFAIGTETLGSIVSPSNRCGTTGLRPTFGRVSRHGVMSLSWSMDKVGPICKNAMDCAIVFDAIRGADNKDRTVINAAFNFTADLNFKDLNVAYLADAFEKDTTVSGVNGRTALNILSDMGLELTPVKLPNDFPFRAFDIILRAEAGAFFDQLVLDHEDRQMVQQNKASRANSLRQSRFIPAVEYLQANRHRQVLIEQMNQLTQKYDAIICPTFMRNQLLITNLTGHPAVTLPTGFDESSHPTSITILGNLFDEATILSIAHQVQQLTEYENQKPAGFFEE